MSNSPRVGECTLNPLKYELNCKTKTAAAIVSALTAIVAVAGIMAILSSQGVNIGALNTLGNIGMIGGGVMAGVGGIVLLATLAWIIGKVIQHCRKNTTKEGKPELRPPLHSKPLGSVEEVEKKATRTREQEIKEIDHTRLAEVFLKDKPDIESGGTTCFKTLTGKTITLHYKSEATFWDIAEKLAVKEDVAPSEFRFVYKGRQINKATIEEMKHTTWKDMPYNLPSQEKETIPNESTIYVLIRPFPSTY